MGADAAVWVGAVATLVLAVVAVFQDPIKSLFVFPDLVATATCDVPDCVQIKTDKIEDGIVDSTLGIYLRLRVKNVGKATACGLLPDFPPIISRDRDCFCPPRAVVVPVV